MEFTNKVVFLALILILLGCASTNEVSSPPTAGPVSGKPALQSQPVIPKYTGPRKRIAVARFDAVGSFMAHYGGWDVGGGLAAQLTTALVDSGYFIVIERAELASVLREQEMALQKIVSKETAAQVGRVLGAQLLVRGAVTEFDQRASGTGLRVGVGTGMFGGGIGGQTTQGIVGMDIRLIDTTTGQIIQSHRAEAKLSATGVSADIDVKGIAFGGDQFDRTVLGQASRKAIDQAVAFILNAMAPIPWTGRVVDVTDGQVYINAGASEGLTPGDTFTVSRVVRELTDPDSGALLGIVEEKLGDIQVVDVREKYSLARMQAPFQTKRGDIVKFFGR